MTSTLSTALRHAEKILQSSDSPRVDAEVLLAFCLKKQRSYLYTWPDKTLSASQWQDFQDLLERRAAGEPIAYLIGEKDFWSLSLSVNPATLIPRPETELLVELALNLLGTEANLSLLDLGTGSGAIALALAKERPQWQITAVDSSADALDTALLNAKKNQLTQINFIHSDWFKQIPKQKFHAIISNPPYIANNDPHLHQGDLRFEPHNALASGTAGMDAIEHLITAAKPWLHPQGWLLLEHGYEQRTLVQTAFAKAGWQSIKTWQDLQGLDRVTGARFED